MRFFLILLTMVVLPRLGVAASPEDSKIKLHPEITFSINALRMNLESMREVLRVESQNAPRVSAEALFWNKSRLAGGSLGIAYSTQTYSDSDPLPFSSKVSVLAPSAGMIVSPFRSGRAIFGLRLSYFDVRQTLSEDGSSLEISSHAIGWDLSVKVLAYRLGNLGLLADAGYQFAQAEHPKFSSRTWGAPEFDHNLSGPRVGVGLLLLEHRP